MEDKYCIVCKKLIPNNGTWYYKIRKYCSLKCKNSFFLYSAASWIKENRISSGSIGAIGELVASVDLMKKGYQVYRALSPSSDCDIIAERNNHIYKFEIRTGRYDYKNRITYATSHIKAPNIIVVTQTDNKVHYFPDLTQI